MLIPNEGARITLLPWHNGEEDLPQVVGTVLEVNEGDGTMLVEVDARYRTGPADDLLREVDLTSPWQLGEPESSDDGTRCAGGG